MTIIQNVFMSENSKTYNHIAIFQLSKELKTVIHLLESTNCSYYFNDWWRSKLPLWDSHPASPLGDRRKVAERLKNPNDTLKTINYVYFDIEEYSKQLLRELLE